MPIYTFKREVDGEPVERFIPMRLAPKIGDVIDIDGEPCRRTVSCHLGLTDDNRTFARYPYVGHSHRRKEHQRKEVLACSKFDKQGRLIVRSAKHERQIAAIEGMKRV